jgi:SAM-dependent methyltransferase
MTPPDNVADSYESHRAEWERQAIDGERRERFRNWFRDDTADWWRHMRMYEPMHAFVHRPDMTVVTIGDGRFGLDSIRLRNLGFSSVLPTDIGDGLLRRSKREGHIREYSVQNAEMLSFGDDGFDIVFCKESYHHFPRAPLALYEMIRVARHAVVLIEPRDYVIDHGQSRLIGPLGLLRGFVRWLRNRAGLRPSSVLVRERYLAGDAPHFEESGNYMYTISTRELEKVALGMGLPAVALKGLNDEYVAGGEGEAAVDDSKLFTNMKGSIDRADQRAKAGIGSTTMLMAVLFKTLPDETTHRFFLEHDWLYQLTPQNPFGRRDEG